MGPSQQVEWGGLARRALGGQGPKMFGLPCVKEKKRTNETSPDLARSQFHPGP